MAASNLFVNLLIPVSSKPSCSCIHSDSSSSSRKCDKDDLVDFFLSRDEMRGLSFEKSSNFSILLFFVGDSEICRNKYNNNNNFFSCGISC